MLHQKNSQKLKKNVKKSQKLKKNVKNLKKIVVFSLK
jgi:hypothetical protein